MGTPERPEKQSDEDLMALVKEDRRDALELLYDRYAGPLLGYLFHTVRDAESARDLLHDAFVRLVEDAASYKFPMPFRPWLFTIARNLALNFIKRRRPRLELNGDSDDHGPAGRDQLAASEPPPALQAEAGEQKETLAAAMASLQPMDREIVLLRLGQGLPYAEIAPVVGLGEDAVRQRLSRAVRRLRDLTGPSE